MKLFKKFLVLSLVVFAVALVSGCERDDEKTTTLVVGTPQISGDFIVGWGNSSYDIYVRDLIHGYSTLVEDRYGALMWDTEAVLASDPVATADADGNKTYTFTLQEDLLFNNGEPVTAKEYVANTLMRSSADWQRIISGNASAGFYLQGFQEYRYGAPTGTDDEGKPVLDPQHTVVDKAFKGVRLLGEYEFSLTIDKAHLPYFWEASMVSASPIHLPSYMPGFEVKDDGQGAYITNVNAESGLTATFNRTTARAPDGNRFQPLVTTGPYQFVSFRQQNVILEKNPNFKTCFEGKTPSIDEIVIKYINQDTDVDQAIAGTVDIVTGVIEGAKIQAALEATTTDAVSYPRNGYGLIAFMCYHGPTQFREVRHALSFLIDRNVFLTEFLGGYGSITNGPFGEAQWFYQESKDDLDDLVNFVLDVNKANELLDQSPYRFELDGTTPFDVSKVTETGNYFRYDSDGNRLHIEHMGTEHNPISVLIRLEYDNNAWQAGVSFNSIEATWDTLIDNYYYGINLEPQDRIYHMFNLATGFTPVYDPYWQFHGDMAGTTNNPYGLDDEDLNEIIERMNVFEPDDREGWRQAFVEYVYRWNYLLPNLPIYSNEYFDVFNTRIEGMQTTPTWTWANDIMNIKVVG